MSSSSVTYIGYSPNNFYYVDALKRGASYAPTDNEECERLINDNTISCPSGDVSVDIKVDKLDKGLNDCIKKQLCINKELAQTLELENSNNGGDKKIMDFQYSYDDYLYKTVNLGIGVCLVFYLMYRL